MKYVCVSGLPSKIEPPTDETDVATSSISGIGEPTMFKWTQLPLHGEIVGF